MVHSLLLNVLFPLSLLAMCALVRADDAPTGKPADKADAAAIKRLVEELGADEFAAREAATEQLTQIGLPAFKAVEEAIQHPDREVRYRAERVLAALRIILADPQVRAVLINIFGGIVRCDMVANGVVAAAKNLGVSIPIVARLEGTNVEEGRRVLAESNIGIITAQGMNDAAQKVVAAAA